MQNKKQSSGQSIEDITKESITNEDSTGKGGTVEQTKEANTSKVTEDDALTTDIDLEEARLCLSKG